MTFKETWEYTEKSLAYPSRARNILLFEFDEFAKNVNEEKEGFTKKIVNSLMEGDFLFLKKLTVKNLWMN